MKRVSDGFKISMLLLVFSSFQLFAQQQNADSSPVHAIQLELKILDSVQQSDVTKIDHALTGYPGKIVNHSYSGTKLFVFITDNIDPVDVLQVLKMNGIQACYRDRDSGYVSLETDGKTTRKLYFKE